MNSWLTVYDNFAEARLVYVSDGIVDCTDFEPEEMIGRTAFEFFHPEDHPMLGKVHVANVLNERLSSMVTYKHLCKNGDWIQVEGVIIYCYELLIACSYIYDENSLQHKMRVSAVDEWYHCLPKKRMQKVVAWKVHKEINITKDQLWINNQLEKSPPEKRVCFILNRFTDDLDIVYASTMASELLNMDPVLCLGQPIYDFLPEEDITSFQSIVDLAKIYQSVFKLRFDWVVNLDTGEKEQVEGIMCSSHDGMVVVLRLSPKVKLEFEVK